MLRRKNFLYLFYKTRDSIDIVDDSHTSLNLCLDSILLNYLSSSFIMNAFVCYCKDLVTNKFYVFLVYFVLI
jgi:hypothetical protein